MISLFMKSGPAENILFLGNYKYAFIHCKELNYNKIIKVKEIGRAHV